MCELGKEAGEGRGGGGRLAWCLRGEQPRKGCMAAQKIHERAPVTRPSRKLTILPLPITGVPLRPVSACLGWVVFPPEGLQGQSWEVETTYCPSSLHLSSSLRCREPERDSLN